MWWKAYRDYPAYEPIKHQQVEPGHGIYGCEMHDLNGWGEEYHYRPELDPPMRDRKGLFHTICTYLFGADDEGRK